jgi:hypothetical protein
LLESVAERRQRLVDQAETVARLGQLQLAHRSTGTST